MSKLNVVTREGREVVLDARAGLSIMEIIREGGIDELLAISWPVRSWTLDGRDMADWMLAV